RFSPFLRSSLLFLSHATAPTEFYTLSLHDALPIYCPAALAQHERIIFAVRPNRAAQARYSYGIQRSRRLATGLRKRSRRYSRDRRQAFRRLTVTATQAIAQCRARRGS